MTHNKFVIKTATSHLGMDNKYCGCHVTLTGTCEWWGLKMWHLDLGKLHTCFIIRISHQSYCLKITLLSSQSSQKKEKFTLILRSQSMFDDATRLFVFSRWKKWFTQTHSLSLPIRDTPISKCVCVRFQIALSSECVTQSCELVKSLLLGGNGLKVSLKVTELYSVNW